MMWIVTWPGSEHDWHAVLLKWERAVTYAIRTPPLSGLKPRVVSSSTWRRERTPR